MADDDGQGCAEVRLFRRHWRELVKRVYEVDPLFYPKCQAEMRIIAFIIDHTVVDKILRHPEREEAERERAPPDQDDLEAQS